MTLFFTKVINLALFIVELTAATALFVTKLERRKLWWVWLIVCVAVIVGALFLYTWLKDVVLSLIDTSAFSALFFGLTYALTALSEALFFFLYACTVFFVFKTSARNTMFVGGASFLTQNIARCLFSLFLIVRGTDSIFLMRAFTDPVNVVVFVAVYAAVFVACYFVFLRRYECGDENFLNRKFLLILVGIILVNIFLCSVNSPQDDEQAAVLYLFVLIAGITLSVMGLILQFFALNWVKLQFQQTQLQSMMNQQREQYEIAKKSIDTVNINAHDLKHQISVIMKAIEGRDNTGQIEDELNEMAKSVNIVDTAYRTGNKALDVALTEKSRICRSKQINFSAIADGSGLGFVTDVDIYTLFGNALDNAIEAAEQIVSAEDRMIGFFLRKERGIVSVHVENTFQKPPRFVNGIPQTGKSDKSFHGFGIRSIIHIVGKYDGNVKMHVKNGLFYLDIILPERTTD